MLHVNIICATAHLPSTPIAPANHDGDAHASAAGAEERVGPLLQHPDDNAEAPRCNDKDSRASAVTVGNRRAEQRARAGHRGQRTV